MAASLVIFIIELIEKKNETIETQDWCFASDDQTGESFCRYNPNRYDDYGDDSDMEANFEDIMKEERRRFALLHFFLN